MQSLYLGLLLAGGCWSLPVAAGDHLDQDQARQAVASGEVMSYPALQERLRHECDCQILEARLHPENDHGRRFWVYEVKALSGAGQLFKLELDAATGEVLHMKSKGRIK